MRFCALSAPKISVDLLLDNHIFLWWESGSDRLGAAGNAIADPRNQIYVSSASIWEIEIKRALGKLAVKGDLIAALSAVGFRTLPITVEHAVAAARLPRHHNDPFDRMLVAQAQIENFTLVSHDALLIPYGIPLLPM